MQLALAAQPELRIADADETGFDAALRRLEEFSPQGGDLPAALLAAACTAAQRALAVIVRGEGTLPWPQFAHAMHIDEQVQACYARAGRWMLSADPLAQPLPTVLIHASMQLFHNLSTVYACEVGGPELASTRTEEGRDPALLFARALWCLGMSAKWTYFMHRGSDGTLWRACHALYQRAESFGIARQAVRLYRDPELGAQSCADVYVQTLLLGMLNAGNLSTQQIELAHRWAIAFVRDAGIETSGKDAAHLFHVCLDAQRGLEAGVPTGGASAAVRFVDIEPVCARLMDSRESLRSGRVDLGNGELQAAVLDYGAFLDLAERFWSPGLNRVQERAPRIAATLETIEVVVGLDRLIRALTGGIASKSGGQHPTGDSAGGGGNITFLHPDAAAQPADVLNCMLKDYSDTGVGLIMSGGSVAPALGTLIGFRMSRSGRWETGVLVRRLDTPETGETLLGIKGISDSPVVVTLQHGKPGAVTTVDAAQESLAVFAPMDNRRSRVDSLILRDVTYSRSKDFLLPTGNTRFHVRLNRVLDRGDGWLRAGYQVLGKK